MFSVPVVPQPDDQEAMMIRHISTVAQQANAMDQLADIEGTLLQHHLDARQAGDADQAGAILRILDHLDVELAHVAHEFSAALAPQLARRGLAGQRAFLAFSQAAQNAARAHGWGPEVMRISVFRDVARQHDLDEGTIWEAFLAFAANYRPVDLNELGQDIVSPAAREMFDRILAATNIPQIREISTELAARQGDPEFEQIRGMIEAEAEGEEWRGGGNLPVPAGDPLPEGDEMLLKQVVKEHVRALFQAAYRRGAEAEGAVGAAEAIHAVITPDPIERMQEPNPVSAQAQQIVEAIPQMAAEIAEADAEARIAGGDAAPVRARGGEDRLLGAVPMPQVPGQEIDRAHRPNREPVPVVELVVQPAQPAEPALPADEVGLEEVLQHLDRGTALGRTLLKGLGFPAAAVDETIKAALRTAVQQIAQAQRPKR